MTRRERNDLISPAYKERACADDERAGPLPHKVCKRHVDVTRGPGIQHNKLQPKNTRGRLNLTYPRRGIRNVQVHEQSNDSRIGHEFVQQRQLLRLQIGTNQLTPVMLPPGRARLATRPSLSGIIADDENDRN